MEKDIEFFFVNGEGYRVILGIRRRIWSYSWYKEKDIEFLLV